MEDTFTFGGVAYSYDSVYVQIGLSPNVWLTLPDISEPPPPAVLTFTRPFQWHGYFHGPRLDNPEEVIEIGNIVGAGTATFNLHRYRYVNEDLFSYWAYSGTPSRVRRTRS